jgi:hypothetical protein
MKGKNGQQKAQENVDAIQAWIDQRNAHRDWGEYEYSGKINRTVVAEELGFAKSVFSQNKRVKELIQEADLLWFREKQLDKLAHEASRERAEDRSRIVSSSNNELIQRNAQLEAENKELKSKLNKFDQLQSLIQAGAAGFKP